jgi:hypothetical protein
MGTPFGYWIILEWAAIFLFPKSSYEKAVILFKTFSPNAFISLFQCTSLAFQAIYTQQYCFDFPKNHPAGIRTRVIWSRGGYDVHCATPPGQKQRLFHLNRGCRIFLGTTTYIGTKMGKKYSK